MADYGLPHNKKRVKAARFGMMRSVSALMLREMGTTYGKSAAGYLWVLLEPLLGIALLSVVFALAFRSPSLGSNFPIFYASGFLPYITYMDISKKVATAINFSKPLLTYPSVTFIDAIFARFFLNLMTQIAVFYILISSIEFLFETNTLHDYRFMVISMVMAGILGLGVGTLNCFLWSYIPELERLWGILNKPLFIISAILYVFEEVPPMYQPYLWWNPLVHITGEMRRGFYPTYEGAYISYIYVFGLGMICLAVGLFLLSNHYKKLLER